MTFFLDNCVPIGLANILKIAQCDVVHFQDEWPDDDFPEGVPDEVWIPQVGKKGWIVVSADPTITTRPAEVLALKKANVIAYFIYRGFTNLRIFDQSRWLFRSWEGIERHAVGASIGRCYQVRSDGKIVDIDWRKLK